MELERDLCIQAEDKTRREVELRRARIGGLLIKRPISRSRRFPFFLPFYCGVGRSGRLIVLCTTGGLCNVGVPGNLGMVNSLDLRISVGGTRRMRMFSGMGVPNDVGMPASVRASSDLDLLER